MIEYKDGFRYQLHKTTFIQTRIRPARNIRTDFISLSRDGLLIVLMGYAWDGASGPVIQTDTTVGASLYHDALYQLIRIGLLDPIWRDAADRLYMKVAIDSGMTYARAQTHYIGLKLFGEPSSLPSAERCVLIAP